MRKAPFAVILQWNPVLKGVVLAQAIDDANAFPRLKVFRVVAPP